MKQQQVKADQRVVRGGQWLWRHYWLGLALYTLSSAGNFSVAEEVQFNSEETLEINLTQFTNDKQADINRQIAAALTEKINTIEFKSTSASIALADEFNKLIISYDPSNFMIDRKKNITNANITQQTFRVNSDSALENKSYNSSENCMLQVVKATDGSSGEYDININIPPNTPSCSWEGEQLPFNTLRELKILKWQILAWEVKLAEDLAQPQIAAKVSLAIPLQFQTVNESNSSNQAHTILLSATNIDLTQLANKTLRVLAQQSNKIELKPDADKLIAKAMFQVEQPSADEKEISVAIKCDSENEKNLVIDGAVSCSFPGTDVNTAAKGILLNISREITRNQPSQNLHTINLEVNEPDVKKMQQAMQNSGTPMTYSTTITVIFSRED